jgi:death-on-curing protein
MRYVSLPEALELHRRIIERTGGSWGVRDLGALESALAQPRMTFDGEELYMTVVEKASAVGFSLIKNHPFIDGNKRIGHAAAEVFLLMNGFEIIASVDEQELIVMRLAASEIGREEFTEWLRANVVEKV